MTKNNKNLWMIIIFLVILLFIIQPGGIQNTENNLKNLISAESKNTGINPNTDFISIRLYDQNRNLIQPSNTFSIVGGVPGVSFIDLTITITNTGGEALSCNIISLTPSEFDLAVEKTTKAIQVGKKTAWTSSLIDVAPLEGGNVEFIATIRCSYTLGTEVKTLPDKTGSLILSILPDSTEASFDVSVESGGTASEYCGDGICQVNEDPESCPADCAIANYVKFRTTDLSYVSGSAIAFTEICGNDLTAYGYSGYSSYICLSENVVVTAPGGYPVCTRPGYAIGDRLYLEKDGRGYIYSSSDSDASKVDTSPTSFDEAKEVSC